MRSRDGGQDRSGGPKPGRPEGGGRILLLAAVFLVAGFSLAPGGAAVAGDQGQGAQLQLPAVPHQDQVDREQLLRDVRVLAHDSMEGRRTGTAGNERARRYLLGRFEEIGLRPFDGSYERRFAARSPDGGQVLEGVNLVGYVPGARDPDLVLVVTAHYDHLGVRNGEIYNGADDNASGTAGLLSLARHFVASPPDHTIVFAAMDAEEMGLQGARAFVASPPLSLSRIRMNVNLDMVSRSEAGELYAAGTYHYPFLSELLEEIEPAPDVELLTGHDRPDLPPAEDWTMASDHAAFHEVGIPFLYFGVEDHAGYHAPSDVFEDITPDFFVGAVETILRFTRLADGELAGIAGNHPAGTGSSLRR